MDPIPIREPTEEEFDALPQSVMDYIHLLESRCDPAGDVMQLMALRRHVAELQALLLERQALDVRTREDWCLLCAGSRRTGFIDRHTVTFAREGAEPKSVTGHLCWTCIRTLEAMVARAASNPPPSR